MVPAHVAAEDALEWFFDHNIAKQFTDKEESSDQEEEEEKEVKKEEQKEVKEEEQQEEEKEVKAPEKWPHPEVGKKEDSSSQNAPAQPELQIRNVICSSSLNCSFDTKLIARKGRNVEYIRKFKQVRIRIRSPRATALISADGRMMISGADSVEVAHRAARRLARIVQKLGFPVHFSRFRVHNFMVMFHTFPISLERLYVALWGHCSYEPELFTGLFYYSGRITACVRHTGNVSVTGSSEVAELTAVFRRLFPTLLQTRSRVGPDLGQTRSRAGSEQTQTRTRPGPDTDQGQTSYRSVTD